MVNKEPTIQYSFRSGFDTRKLEKESHPNGMPFYLVVKYDRKIYRITSLINNSRAKSTKELEQIQKTKGIQEIKMLKHIIKIETANHTKPLPAKDLSDIIRDYRYTMQEALAIYGIILIRHPWKYFKKTKLENESTYQYNRIESMFSFIDYFPLKKEQEWNSNIDKSLEKNIELKLNHQQKAKKRELMLNDPITFFNSIYGAFINLKIEKGTEMFEHQHSITIAKEYIDLADSFVDKNQIKRIDNTVYNWFFGDLKNRFSQQFKNDFKKNPSAAEAKFLIIQGAFFPTDFRLKSNFSQYLFKKLDSDEITINKKAISPLVSFLK
ncbi:MAG: hypothetical protein R8N23_03635 [Reichenbachiella sp.]|uniref:hypothetical protein n=1 Tax=Reichenbachiella sp. TaxID=2184521 RepID=UPI002966C5FE|nr:hypothetical protein [Reichenbachiella sp.]MDW3208930.1 hypothetical protein [Reichenbachiella sp.]